MVSVKTRLRLLAPARGGDDWRSGGKSKPLDRLRRRKPMKWCDHPSSTLLIAFGGLRGEFGMPFFEFSTLTEGLEVKRLFVRDLRQAWYHRGMPGYGDSLMDVESALARIVEREQPDRLVMVGNSAGGYAALLFGTLLGAERVLCFSPQTLVDPDALAAMDDRRWHAWLQPLADAGALDRRWTDLRPGLGAARVADTSYEVYFDEGDDLDRVHAERLAGLAGLTLFPMAEGEHFVVRKMRNSGALEQVLRRALFPPAAAVPP
jgi:hypothetical protein